jgi:hypothetical protein
MNCGILSFLLVPTFSLYLSASAGAATPRRRTRRRQLRARLELARSYSIIFGINARSRLDYYCLPSFVQYAYTRLVIFYKQKQIPCAVEFEVQRPHARRAPAADHDQEAKQIGREF